MWVSPTGRVGLGHTRLAIVGPNGAQPIQNENGRFHAVVNGEFYGYQDIRTSLQRRGHRFRTDSDSEILLHLYEDTGTRCLESLRGQFAFVLWDEGTGTLLAARDRFGLKPLFYSERPEALYIASEAKALFAAGVAASWDTAGVYHVLHACPAEDRSLFAGVSQLPPGCMLIATNGAVRISRYWDIPKPTDGHRVEYVDPADAQQEVKSLVEESVRLRMIADVPVGCLLSGGLDSSSILGVAAHCTSKPVAAFTVGFSDDAFDESPDAGAMAEHVGATHHVIRVDERDMADHFHDAVWHAEMVQYNSHGTARYLLSRGVRAAGYKTVLAGEGADEIFFGYEFTRAAARAQSMTTFGRFRAVLRLLRPKKRWSEGLSATSPWLARLTALLDVSPDLLERLTGALDRLRRIQSASLLESFDGYDVYRAFYKRCDAQAGISRRAPAHQLNYLWLHSIFSGYHLAADRLDMSHGVEVRLPFLDHVLVERVSRLPLPLLACQPREKALLRDALGGYLPDFVHTRPKRPFWAPPSAARTCNAFHDLIQDTLRGPQVRALPFFDHTAVRELADGVHAAEQGGRASLDSLVMVVASLAVLQERYGLGSGTPQDRAISVA